MAYTDGVSLEVEYTSPQNGDTFSYATIETADSFPNEAQISVRWEVVTIEDTNGAPVQTSELTASIREQIFRLDEKYLTFNAAVKTVTVDAGLLGGDTVTVDDGVGGTIDYVYGAFTLINAVNPVKLRRSVNVTNPIVDFQKGSRLTSNQLNAATQQLLFAAQEQSIFGTSSDQSDVDLGGESINNLGDVNINLTNSGALLTVGLDGSISDSTTSGTNAVLSVNGETGIVALDSGDVGAAPVVHTHVMSDVTDLNISGVGGIDVAAIVPVAGDTMVFDGTNWVPGAPVTVASGTGAPPSAWTNDPIRQDGDLYIRRG